MIASLIDALVAGLKEPFELLLDPDKRVYWPFLLGSLALAFAVLLRRKRSASGAARELFRKDVWLHRSALMDYRLVPVKMFVYVLLLAPLVLSALGLAVAVASWLDASFGAAGASSLSTFEITAIYTLVLFVAWDASRYIVHRLLHSVPWLWQFHKVHHSAEVLTPFTVHRVHPVESLLFGIRGAAVTGVVTGVFFYLFADAAVQYELLGVNAVGLVFNAIGSNLRHSHVWLSYGARIERLFLSPAQHQLHHSNDPQHYNCNYGSYLSIWDRAGGSLRLAGERRQLRFGLTLAERNHDPASVRSALMGPLVSMVGQVRTWLPTAAAVAAVIALSCSDDAPGGPDAKIIDFDRQALLTNLGENILLPTVERFDTDATSLATAVGDYCGALGGGEETAELANARAAWGLANITWQHAELMQLGPMRDNAGELHDVIYSWPVVSACAVDQDVMALRDDPSFDVTTRLTNRRGLDAVEYLLFAPTLDSVCPPQTLPAGWDALSDPDKKAARCELAQVVANDVAQQATTLADAWRPAGGNFLGNLTSAGTGSSTYATADDAVNEIFGALFYMDAKTKDMKLAEPIGVLPNLCGTMNEACAAERESQFANVSKDNVGVNLAAFESVFTGDDGVGLADFVRAAGGDSVALSMETALTDARNTAQSLPGTLDEALNNNYAGVVELHGKVKAITDLLKTDIPNLTGLQVPPDLGGDTD